MRRRWPEKAMGLLLHALIYSETSSDKAASLEFHNINYPTRFL